MKRSGRFLDLVAAGVALGATASLPAGASAGGSSTVSVIDGPARSVAAPSGPGWKVYASSVPLSAKVTVVEGKKNVDGSCTLSESGSVPPGGLAEHSDEIAFNASTCESQISQYRLSNEEAVVADAVGESTGVAATETEQSGFAAPAPAGVGALATYSEGAYSRTWYEDPPGLDVTSVRNSTNWSYNGSCVLSNTARANYSWLSGWSKLSSNLNGGYTCARSTSSSYAKFRNGIFCLTIDTYNTYDRNNIWGQENGGYSWSYNVTKSGGCTALLSVHHSSAFN